jgi:hypothetical protein
LVWLGEEDSAFALIFFSFSTALKPIVLALRPPIPPVNHDAESRQIRPSDFSFSPCRQRRFRRRRR